MKYRKGEVNPLIIIIVVMGVVIAGLGGLSVWAYVNYSDQKNNTDSKVSVAVAEAVKEQKEIDEANFFEREKEPNIEFVGPDDYGRVSFMYPKTWSVYIGKDISNGGDYEAYLHPVKVNPVSPTEIYALRVSVLDKDYDAILKTYESLIKKGDLKSSAFATDGANGTRLDGNFTKDIRGSAVIMKIRDKTLVVRTDAETFRGDFEKIITTIRFNS